MSFNSKLVKTKFDLNELDKDLLSLYLCRPYSLVLKLRSIEYEIIMFIFIDNLYNETTNKYFDEMYRKLG